MRQPRWKPSSQWWKIHSIQSQVQNGLGTAFKNFTWQPCFFCGTIKAHGSCKFVSLTHESCYYFSLLLFKLSNCFTASPIVSPSIPISSEMSCFGDFKIPFPVANPFYFMPFPPSWVFPSLSSAISAVAMLWC